VLGADQDGEAVCSRSITVSDADADGILTYDEALQAAHKTCLTEDDYTTENSDWGLMVSKLWGVETSNCLFYLDGKALENNVADTVIKAGSKLYASVNSDDTYYSDQYTAFDAADKTITAGVDFELTLQDAEGSAVSGLEVGIWKDGAFEAIEGKTTDENGKVTLNFSEVGTYCVTANGTVRASVTTDWATGETQEMDCPIMAPGCLVSVKQLGELKFTSLYAGRPDHFGDQPYTYKVGEVNTFYSLLTARYYMDGTWDRNVTVTTSWYRIKDGETEPQKVDNISAAFTDADLGTWQYYMYAECNAYGVPLTAQTNYATVIVSEPTPLEGSSANGYITGLRCYGDYASGPRPDFVYEEGKTDYDIFALDNGSAQSVSILASAGKGLWIGRRINGVHRSGDYEDTDKEPAAWDLQSGFGVTFPGSTVPGETNVVSVIVGLKYDSNQDGVINQYDDFDPELSDIVNFHITTRPSLSSLAVYDTEENEITVSPTIGYNHYYDTDFYGTTNEDTVKLTARFKDTNDVKLYLGDSKTPFTESLVKHEIRLTNYRDAQGTANIPLKTVWEDENAVKLERTVTLHLSKEMEAPDAPVITKQPEAETTIEKDTTAKLSVEVEQPTDGSTIRYQWKTATSKFGPYQAGIDIEGATESTYDAPAQERIKQNGAYKYFACQVTKTAPNGATSSVLSDSALVNTNLTYVNPPKISVQPGLTATSDGKGVYKTEYTAGSCFDTMWIGVQSESVRTQLPSGSYTYINVTELGCNEFEVECFYNTTPSVEGATPMPFTKSSTGMSGSMGSYRGYTPTEGLPEGEYYVFFKITSTAADDPSKTAFTYTDFVKLTFTKADFGMEGSGTPADPFLLKTGEDFVKIQKLVNEQGQTLSGMTFRMANDITLPEDWVSIGSDGTNGKYFGGTLDGDGHQLSYAKHSLPLFEYTSNAVIRNLRLYGEEIQGCGLINNSWLDENPRATIDNVTLVSGTSTLRSGLTAGGAKAANRTIFTNCHAEEGVIIGYTGNESHVATFTSNLMGTMENCTSAATVYGVSYVGGLAAGKGNSMSQCSIKNCSFTGTIEATGSFVGGIASSGYYATSAPNATCVKIENCYVNADISGKDAVGGIFGGEEGIDQCWDNGIGYIRNNVFYGSLHASGKATTDNIGGSKGGIIGFMRSLNKYNIIENNYFYDENGCEKAIGGVEHIDTSTHEFGMGDDGIFYYDTSRDSLADIKDFVDAEDKGTPDEGYTSVCKTDHNRTDDPMGKDADKLGRACTTTEMTDGTVVKQLNENENSMKNWEQGDTSPILSSKAVATSLTLSGNYKTEYYIGESLDMTGAVFTAYWSDGSTTNPGIDDVKIEGFDSSKRAVLTLKASYDSVSTEFEVKVLKKPASGGSSDTIKVYFTLLGDEKHGDVTDETGTHTLKDKNLQTWIAKTSYELDDNSTVWDLLKAVEGDHDVTFSNPSGNYVDYVTFNGNTLGEFDNGNLSGWMYTRNNKHPLLGVAEQFLENGDNIVWHYTDDYTVEEGSEPWENENHGGGGSGGGSASTPAADNENDQKATDAAAKLIDEIGEVTEASGDAITAARDAYNKLTEAQKKLVSNYSKLTAAEQAYAKLTGKLPFTDISGHWALEAIQYAYQNGLFSGTSDTTFGPNVAMNRAMLVTVLYRMEGEPEITGTNGFADVASGQWYTDAVVWASANGIVSGYSTDKFGPTDTVTREQMASILNRYAAFKGYDVTATTELTAFTDMDTVSDWASEAVKWANAEKLINGRTATTLVPKGSATRAEVAQILMTFAQNVAQ
ncbi:MAG: S-layer homology domain-containing protein, partial [Butyricicoccus sp.]